MCFRMTAVYDSLSCYFDFLNYQKREIVDTFDQLLDTKTDLLVDGTLFCTNDLPLTYVDFKLFQQDLYTRPVILRDFTLDENSTQTIVRCNVTYDSEMVSKPLFIFPNKKFKNVELIKKNS